MATPERALVRHDDATDLRSTTAARYSSIVRGVVPAPGTAMTLELRLSFQDKADRIHLGAVGVRVRLPPDTMRGYVNVRDYGATGDGTTVDSNAIQAAVNAAVAANEAVYIPSGRYILGCAIRLMDTVVVFGDGWSSILTLKNELKNEPKFFAGAFWISNANDVVIRDLCIDCNRGNTSDGGNDSYQNGIYVEATCAGLKFTNLYIKNGWRNGFRLNGYTSHGTPAITNWAMTDCRVESTLRGGLIGYVSNFSMVGCKALSCTDGGWVIGYAEQFSLIGCEASNNYNHGFTFGTVASGFTVNGCVAKSNGGIGIVATFATCNFAFVGNRCDANEIGISLDLRKPAPNDYDFDNADATVVGNVCTNSIQSHGIYVQYCTGVAIIGNTCYSNIHSGIYVIARKCSIVGNVCHDNGGGGAGYGIGFSEPAGHPTGQHQIVGNRCWSNQYGGIGVQGGMTDPYYLPASQASLSSIPTSGTWVKGDFCWNSSPVETGSQGSKYVIVGWLRVTNGSNHVANSDWLEMRVPTGN
jgi:parallel beta-helix repeat protein